MRRFLAILAACTLFGCGVGDYFDQHPPNVRDANSYGSDDDDALIAAARAKASGTTMVSAATQPVMAVSAPAPSAPPSAPAHPNAAGARVAAPVADVPLAPAAQSASATQERHALPPVATVAVVEPDSPVPVISPGKTTHVAPAVPPQAREPETQTEKSLSPAMPVAPKPALVTARAETTETAPVKTEAAISIPPTPSVASDAGNGTQPPAPAPAVTPTTRIGAPPVLIAQSPEQSQTTSPIMSQPSPVLVSSTGAAPASGAPSQMPGANTINAHCEAVAKSRADDAAANGKDDELQKAVHDGTYANCVAWENTHGGGD